MRNILIIALIVSGILFAGSVLMMSPKGGLGSIAGMSGGGDSYGSKKSVESTLKTVAYITGIVFVAVSIFLPYM